MAGKKPKQSIKASKPLQQHSHHEKTISNQLIKNMRPKVYITHSSRFKNLVQQLTGNGNENGSASNSPVSSPPTYLDHVYNIQDQDIYSMSSLNSSRDSSCFSTPLEGSPEYMLESSFGYNNNNNNNQKMEFSWEDLELLLKDMEPVSCYDQMIDQQQQQEVCVYDYDLSTVML